MLLIILSTFVMLSSHHAHLVDSDNYAATVTKKMMEHFGENPNVLDLLKMQDFTQKIDATRFGRSVVGPMRFHSGFVMSIGSALISKNQSFVTDKNVLVRLSFELHDLRTTYDIRFELEDYKADGAVIMKFVAIAYEIKIIRPVGSLDIEATIKCTGTTGGQKFMEILIDPDNEYTQIIARELKLSKTFRNPIENSFGEWAAALKPALQKAIKEIPFPKIDYYRD